MRLDRTCHGGGISIYIRDSVNFKPRDDIPADGLELICIEIEPPKSKPFLVIAWYRPPSDPVGSFDRLEKVLAYLDREGEEMILLVDTNCDFTRRLNDELIDNNAKHMANIYELFSFSSLLGSQQGSLLKQRLSLTTLPQHVPETLLGQGFMRFSQ